LQQQELIVEKPGDTGLFLFVIAPLGATLQKYFFTPRIFTGTMQRDGFRVCSLAGLKKVAPAEASSMTARG
jgi:hypothetical protein